MSNLTYLNDASVLHNLKQRYYAKLIYVRLRFILGEILPCCNPVVNVSEFLHIFFLFFFFFFFGSSFVFFHKWKLHLSHRKRWIKAPPERATTFFFSLNPTSSFPFSFFFLLRHYHHCHFLLHRNCTLDRNLSVFPIFRLIVHQTANTQISEYSPLKCMITNVVRNVAIDKTPIRVATCRCFSSLRCLLAFFKGKRQGLTTNVIDRSNLLLPTTNKFSSQDTSYLLRIITFTFLS